MQSIGYSKDIIFANFSWWLDREGFIGVWHRQRTGCNAHSTFAQAKLASTKVDQASKAVTTRP